MDKEEKVVSWWIVIVLIATFLGVFYGGTVWHSAILIVLLIVVFAIVSGIMAKNKKCWFCKRDAEEFPAIHSFKIWFGIRTVPACEDCYNYVLLLRDL